MKPWTLRGGVAVITGAASGIGAALAVDLARRGMHLALVDPMESGTSRGVVVLTGDGSLLVGPDNGLLSLAWDQRGGIAAANEITNPRLWAQTVHPTFRGRDVFAPVASHPNCR